jgi:hypothetical protein
MHSSDLVVLLFLHLVTALPSYSQLVLRVTRLDWRGVLCTNPLELRRTLCKPWSAGNLGRRCRPRRCNYMHRFRVPSILPVVAHVPTVAAICPHEGLWHLIDAWPTILQLGTRSPALALWLEWVAAALVVPLLRHALSAAAHEKARAMERESSLAAGTSG